MKAILYIGAILMVGASIYGFIDYNKSSRDKNFRNLYENKEQEAIKKEEKSSVTQSVPDVKIKEENKSIMVSSIKPVVIKKKRKISSEKFSRGALDEKYLKEEVKKDSKKKPANSEKEKQ